MKMNWLYSIKVVSDLKKKVRDFTATREFEFKILDVHQFKLIYIKNH